MGKTMIEPMGGRVLVRADEKPTKSPGGILIPEAAIERPWRGTVMAVGPGVREDGIQLAKGERVIFGRYAGAMIEIDGEELLLLSEDELLAKISDR